MPCLDTGDDVLDKYSFDEANLYRDIVAMLVLYGAFHVLAFASLWRRARKKYA